MTVVDLSQLPLIRPLQDLLVCLEMAEEHDSEAAPATSLGSSTFRTSCYLCDSVLEQDWPDLSTINPLNIKNRAGYEWERAAESGCPFCNIVVSVVDDAREQYGCSTAEESSPLLNPGLPYGENTRGFQVFLGPRDSTGRYLLALELVMMPLLVEPGFQKEFWGIITVYLDGEPSLWLLECHPFCMIFPRGRNSQLFY